MASRQLITVFIRFFSVAFRKAFFIGLGVEYNLKIVLQFINVNSKPSMKSMKESGQVNVDYTSCIAFNYVSIH
jgi:hypothetical protein